ncbi:hypothetical protein SAMN05444157_3171 [Frankineae bacterium MT45]|nr:hypothetical protein SAMN05444157_3171 [Frankineae bacterium MT45]
MLRVPRVDAIDASISRDEAIVARYNEAAKQAGPRQAASTHIAQIFIVRVTTELLELPAAALGRQARDSIRSQLNDIDRTQASAAVKLGSGDYAAATLLDAKALAEVAVVLGEILRPLLSSLDLVPAASLIQNAADLWTADAAIYSPLHDLVVGQPAYLGATDRLVGERKQQTKLQLDFAVSAAAARVADVEVAQARAWVQAAQQNVDISCA